MAERGQQITIKGYESFKRLANGVTQFGGSGQLPPGHEK
jgi:hypothetical protein